MGLLRRSVYREGLKGEIVDVLNIGEVDVDLIGDFEARNAAEVDVSDPMTEHMKNGVALDGGFNGALDGRLDVARDEEWSM